MTTHQPVEEIHLRDYLGVIKKWLKLISAFTLIVVAFVTITTFSMTPQYEGLCRVMIEKGEKNNLTNLNAYTSYDPEFYETQFQLIKSKRVAVRVVQLLSLVDRWEVFNGDPTSFLWRLRNIFNADVEKGADTPVLEEKIDIIADALLEGLSVSPIKNSRLVAITYLSPNPVFSALVANTFAEAYINEVYTMKMETTRRTLDWMSKKASQESAHLEDSEQKLQQYMGDNEIVTMENRIAVLPQQLAEISTQLVRAETKRKELQAEYEMAHRVVDDTDALANLPGLAESKELDSLRNEIQAAKQKNAELSKKYGYKHPAIIKANDDLALLEERRRRVLRQGVDKIHNRFQLAITAENDLKAQLDKIKEMALSMSEKFIQYGVIKRELDTNKQLYDALMLKMKEMSITEEGQTVNLYIVDHAQEAKFPVKPRKKKNLLLGLIVGLLGGIGLAFFVEYLDNNINSSEDLQRRFNVPVMSVLPQVKEKSEDCSCLIDEIAARCPLSSFSEGIKSLRTSLLLSRAEGSVKNVLVTSAQPGEGKTTIVLNLAESLAQAGFCVLVIDADLRKPRLHKAVKCSLRNGLSSYLAGIDSECFIQQNQIGGSWQVITAGPIPPNPSELLVSERMKKLVESFSTRYDYVLCDSAPLLSVSDSMTLASLFAGTLLVCRAHKTTYDDVQRSLERLHNVRASLLGVAINGYNIKFGDDYYYQYRYGSYVQEPETQA